MKRLNLMAGATAAVSAMAVALISVGGTGAATADTTTTTTSTTVPTSTTSTSSTTTVPGGPPTTTSSVPGTTTTTAPTTTTTTAPASAEQVIAGALVAVQGERGVKWSYIFAAGGVSFSEQAHAGISDGALTDTLHFTRSGNVQFILHHRLYFRGTAYGLTQDLNFKPKFASLEAGKWISASTSAFLDVTAAMTMAGVGGEIDLIGGSMSVAPVTTLKGVSVIPVKETASEGGTKVSQIVYIKATGSPLPVEVIRQVEGIEAVITYRDWGQPPHVSAPAKAVAFQASWLTS